MDPILQARQAAAAAEAEVAKISRAHLGTLMASPPRVRMAHLTDPELTPADRTELEHSVRAALPRSAPVTSAPSKLRWLSPAAAAGVRIQVCRGHRPAGGRRPARRHGMAQHGRADGGVKHHVDRRLAPAGRFDLAWLMEGRLAAIAMGPHNGKVVLRYWLNGRGYATTEVDENWLLGNSFDYVVVPTGATGVVSPANR